MGKQLSIFDRPYSPIASRYNQDSHSPLSISSLTSTVSTSASTPTRTPTTKSSPSSPSRLLFASMAVIHQDISHTYSSMSEESDGLHEDNSLIFRSQSGLAPVVSDADADAASTVPTVATSDQRNENEGLEVILNFDRSLSYQDC